jgi:hypothetical protein
MQGLMSAGLPVPFFESVVIPHPVSGHLVRSRPQQTTAVLWTRTVVVRNAGK